ncbi:hypothetical protein B566_EDAN016797 [Ephemera danica]|nr:hypothetical protein B566_EDAN016797 [Ephemera danica]
MLKNIMVFHSCFNNLKGFAISRPPLVVFTLCLTSLAIATLSLARLVSQSDSLPNPDVRLDWNLLLERMANLDLCIRPDDNPMIIMNSTVPSSDIETVTALLEVAKEVHSTLHNITQISGAIPAQLLGLGGPHLVTVSFRVDVNSSYAHLPSYQQQSATATNLVNSARLQARAQGPQMVDNWCDDGTFLRLAYHSNPQLTATLTLHDRSVVNLHLMHTSYFLLVMAMTLVCYALLKGKPTVSKQPVNSIEKVPLDP